MLRVQELRWEIGPVLLEQFKANLSHQENQFFKAYNTNLNNYMKATGVDLTTDVQPPKELFIEVRCLQDYGEYQTENGTVNLQENCQYFLPRTDVEQLVRRGILAHVHST